MMRLPCPVSRGGLIHARRLTLHKSSLAAAVTCTCALKHVHGQGEALSLPIKSWAMQYDESNGFFHEVVTLAIDHDESQLPPSLDELSSTITLEARYDPQHDPSSLWTTDINGLSHVSQACDDAFDQGLISTWVRTGQWKRQVENGLLLSMPLGGGEEEEEGSLSLILGLPGSSVEALLTLKKSSRQPLQLSIQTHSGGVDIFEWPDYPHHCIHKLSTGQVAVYTGHADLNNQHGEKAWQLLSANKALDLAEPLFGHSVPDDSSVSLIVDGSRSDSGGAEVDVARAEGGQFLLRAKIISPSSASPKPAWFLLDTCCETSCITPSITRSGSLPPSFGSQKLHSIGGESLSCPMRRGIEVLLGSYYVNKEEQHLVTLPPSDVYQVISLDGSIVAPTLSSGISGVLGGSFLNRCVLEVKAPKRSPGARSPPKTTAHIYSSSSYDSIAVKQGIKWHRLHFIDSQPHVEATLLLDDIDSDETSSGLKGLFRLALGIGGVGCLLSTQAARDLGFLDRSAPLMVQGGLMAGPGSSLARFESINEDEVLSFRLPRLRVQGGEGEEGGSNSAFEFKNLRSIVHLSSAGGGLRGLMNLTPTRPHPGLVEGGGRGSRHEGLSHAPKDLALSLRASGLVGADAIRGCSVVLDYAKMRVAFTRA